MATIVPSRYALLSIDDDDDVASRKKKIPNKKPTEVKPQNAASVKSNGNTRKKKKQESTQPQTSKNPKLSSGNTSKKKKAAGAEQWEEWKQKDAELAQGHFEEDLSKAIFLSKLDYEQKKDYYDTISKNQQKEKKPNSKKNKKSQRVMSLNEFNNLGAQNSKKNVKKELRTDENGPGPGFFGKLDEDIKNEISKEHLVNLGRANDLNSQESLTLVLYKACIEERDREIEQLKGEVERLNTELKNVKIRNTKLCQVIANGEMKDKAEVLMEVERLQTIKDELSCEVATLHIQLEQERSKVRQLTGEHKNKEKNKKHHSVDSQ